MSIRIDNGPGAPAGGGGPSTPSPAAGGVAGSGVLLERTGCVGWSLSPLETDADTAVNTYGGYIEAALVPVAVAAHITAVRLATYAGVPGGGAGRTVALGVYGLDGVLRGGSDPDEALSILESGGMKSVPVAAVAGHDLDVVDGGAWVALLGVNTQTTLVGRAVSSGPVQELVNGVAGTFDPASVGRFGTGTVTTASLPSALPPLNAGYGAGRLSMFGLVGVPL